MQHFTNEMLRADSIHGGFESVPLEIFRIDVPQVSILHASNESDRLTCMADR